MKLFLRRTATPSSRRPVVYVVYFVASWAMLSVSACATRSPDDGATTAPLTVARPRETSQAPTSPVISVKPSIRPAVSAVPSTLAGPVARSDDSASMLTPITAPPSRLVIDRIGVNVALDRLGLGGDGELAVPADPEDAGWWRSRVRTGPTVIVGHVDSLTGPAVFFRLGQLNKGDRITVHYDDAQGPVTEAFLVRDLEHVRKASFPSERVYRGSAEELRLITCGGRFDRKTGHYVDNVIVYATQLP